MADGDNWQSSVHRAVLDRRLDSHDSSTFINVRAGSAATVTRGAERTDRFTLVVQSTATAFAEMIRRWRAVGGHGPFFVTAHPDLRERLSGPLMRTVVRKLRSRVVFRYHSMMAPGTLMLEATY